MNRSSTGTSHKIGEENRKGERDYLTRIDIDRDVVSGAGLSRMREEGRTQPSMRGCTMDVNMHAEGAYLFFKGFFFFFFVGSKEKGVVVRSTLARAGGDLEMEITEPRPNGSAVCSWISSVSADSKIPRSSEMVIE